MWFAVRRTTPERRKLWWGILLAGLVPLALSIAYNLHKFDHVYMFPLQDQIWTQVNAHRREALGANGGAITGFAFFPTAFHAYLWPHRLRFVDYFPWITLPPRPPEALAGAFVDQAYRTGSATAFMPLFMLLQVVSTVVVFSPWASASYPDPAGADVRVRADHRRRDGLRLLRRPLRERVRPGAGPRRGDRHDPRRAGPCTAGGPFPVAAGVAAALAAFSMAAQLSTGL